MESALRVEKESLKGILMIKETITEFSPRYPEGNRCG